MNGTLAVDGIALFDRLAEAMNGAPERYEGLGDVNVDLALVMRRPGSGDAFRLLLGFRGIRCETVAELAEGEERTADCWLEGDLDHWRAMFADIVANGRAKGRVDAQHAHDLRGAAAAPRRRPHGVGQVPPLQPDPAGVLRRCSERAGQGGRPWRFLTAPTAGRR